MTRFFRYAAPLTCAVVLVACNRDRTTMGDRDRPPGSDPGTTTITGAKVPSLSQDSAVTRIATQRCTREMSCNNVGPDKRYSSHDICTQTIRADMKNDLNASECPRGIDQKELDECLAEIKNESCNNPIDKIERLVACRTSDLCLKR